MLLTDPLCSDINFAMHRAIKSREKNPDGLKELLHNLAIRVTSQKGSEVRRKNDQADNKGGNRDG